MAGRGPARQLTANGSARTTAYCADPTALPACDRSVDFAGAAQGTHLSCQVTFKPGIAAVGRVSVRDANDKELQSIDWPITVFQTRAPDYAKIAPTVESWCDSQFAALLKAEGHEPKLPAVNDARSPLHGRAAQDLMIEGDRLVVRGTSRGERLQTLFARHGQKFLEAQAGAKPGGEKDRYSMYAFGAQFAEVRLDALLGEIRVSRMLGVFGAGKILNAKVARSQFIGGMVWGIGFALYEDTVMDERLGRIVNNNFAEYHIPVNADVPAIESLRQRSGRRRNGAAIPIKRSRRQRIFRGSVRRRYACGVLDEVLVDAAAHWPGK